MQDSNPDFQIRTQIQMSAGSVPTGSGFILLLASVISPSIEWNRLVTTRNANKFPKIPYSAMVREMEKWSGIRIRDQLTIKR